MVGALHELSTAHGLMQLTLHRARHAACPPTRVGPSLYSRWWLAVRPAPVAIRAAAAAPAGSLATFAADLRHVLAVSANRFAALASNLASLLRAHGSEASASAFASRCFDHFRSPSQLTARGTL